MKTVIAAIVACVVVGVGAYFLFGSNESSGEEEAVLGEGETVTAEQAEAAVRELVELDGSTLNAAIFANSEDALSNLVDIAPSFVADAAVVGDFYLVFDSKQVLYRPSTNKVVQIVPVVRPEETEPIAEAETIDEVEVATTSVSEVGE